MLNRNKDKIDKRLIKKKGVVYSKELDKYVLDGYGIYLTSCNIVDLEKNLAIFDELGYEIVFGPVLSEEDGINFGLYCSNYINVVCTRELFRDDIDGLIKRIVNVSLLKDGAKKETLDKMLVEELKFFSNMITSFEADDFYKVINGLNGYKEDSDSVTLDKVVDYLKNIFYDRISSEMDKDVDGEKVSKLVEEAKCLSHDFILTRHYPFLVVWDPNMIDDSINAMKSFVNKVKEENTTGEIRGLLNGLRIRCDLYVEGSDAIVNDLDEYVKNKTIDDFGSKSKVKIKKNK